jgi:fumarate reductase subunit D
MPQPNRRQADNWLHQWFHAAIKVVTLVTPVLLLLMTWVHGWITDNERLISGLQHKVTQLEQYMKDEQSMGCRK